MITVLVIAWLLCSAFNVFCFSMRFEYVPVTLLDILVCTIFAPAMFLISLMALINKVVIIKARK